MCEELVIPYSNIEYFCNFAWYTKYTTKVCQ